MAHVMTDEIDAGSIVGVEWVKISPTIDRLNLEALSHQLVVQLFHRLATDLATSDEVLTILPDTWSARVTTRQDFETLCEGQPYVSENEFHRRHRSIGEGHEHAMFVTLHGRRFLIENMPGDGKVYVGGRLYARTAIDLGLPTLIKKGNHMMTELAGSDTNGWLLNPSYQVEFDPIPALVRVEFGGAVIAESTGVMVMYELGHAPMYYLPRDDVDMACLQVTGHDTYCPYKGHASYWTATAGDAVAENAVWSYLKPHVELARLDGFLGFYWGKMDAWYEDGVAVSGPREIPGRIDTTTQLKRLFPDLAAEWHPTRNTGIKPYEFPPYSSAVVWWQNASGREWQERIRDRVLAATTLKADGDAHPYG
jgi:uncharacterized protein (DUF427 family)